MPTEKVHLPWPQGKLILFYSNMLLKKHKCDGLKGNSFEKNVFY